MFGSARGCDFEEYYKPPPTGEHVCPDTQRRIYDWQEFKMVLIMPGEIAFWLNQLDLHVSAPFIF